MDMSPHTTHNPNTKPLPKNTTNLAKHCTTQDHPNGASPTSKEPADHLFGKPS